MLESLQRHPREEPTNGTGREAEARRDATVLATLARGQSAGRSTSRIGRALLVIVAAGVLVVLVGTWWVVGNPLALFAELKHTLSSPETEGVSARAGVPTPARRAAVAPVSKRPEPPVQNSAAAKAPEPAAQNSAAPETARPLVQNSAAATPAPKLIATPRKGPTPATEGAARARTVAPASGDKQLASAGPAAGALGSGLKSRQNARVSDLTPTARQNARSSDLTPGAVQNGSVRLLPNEKPAADEFTLAVYYHTAGDFQNALIHYHAFLEKQPLNLEAHNNLGLLYQGKGLNDDAIAEFRKAIAIDPKYAKAHNNLGVTLLGAGKVDAAVAEFRYLQKDDPKNVEALVNLAIALQAADHVDEAKDTLIRAVALNPKLASARYNLGVIYEREKELAHAIEHYEAFLKYAGADQASLSADVRSRLTALRQRIGQ